MTSYKNTRQGTTVEQQLQNHSQIEATIQQKNVIKPRPQIFNFYIPRKQYQTRPKRKENSPSRVCKILKTFRQNTYLKLKLSQTQNDQMLETSNIQ